MLEPIDTTLRETFLAPLFEVLESSNCTRQCLSHFDADHLECGVDRALSDHRTGRAWLQSFTSVFKLELSVNCFFKALKSKRRTEVVEQVSLALADRADASDRSSDPFASIGELKGYAVYASDGHCLSHSCHSAAIKGKLRADCHIFSLNLRNSMMEPLGLCVPEPGKAKQHEIAALKKLGKSRMRMRQPKGTKVLHAYDPAVVDYGFWRALKQAGVYVITVEKKNSALTVVGKPAFDRRDPRNAGVLDDELVGPSNGEVMRRVTYRDPVSGKIYKFLTTVTDLKVPPGALAFVYKCRWNVEKTFDQTKNRFMERKSWGKSENAKRQQAFFVCLAHNLCVELERKLEQQEQIVDRKLERKRELRRQEESRRARDAGRTMNSLVQSCSVATQRSCQFIRWLRHGIEHSCSWRDSVEALRPLMEKYLA